MKNGYFVEDWNFHNKCHVYYENNKPIYVRQPDHYTTNWIAYINKKYQIHKLDGPAVEVYDDINKKEWWFDGEYLPQINSQEDFEKYLLLKVFE